MWSLLGFSQDLWRRQPGRNGSIVRRIASSLPRRPRLFTKRSIVREIGSRLPLRPVKRPHFNHQITDSSGSSLRLVSDDDSDLSQIITPAFSDVGWIMGPSYFDGESSSCTSSDLTEDHTMELEDLISLENEPDEELEAICSDEAESTKMPQMGIIDNSTAIEKISALEDELNKLRLQIATLVANPPSTPAPTPAPLSSTPCTPGAPPPPPPPPPPPAPGNTGTPVKSVMDIIKEKRSRRMTVAGTLDLPTGAPNMSDVLKGLGSVRLKSVERSPGGTPIRNKPLEIEGTDPASIIARALKKKFAKRRRVSDAQSPDADKENISSFSPSPNNSPQKLPFGPHLLKPSKGRRLSGGKDLQLRRSVSSPLAEVNR